MTSSPRGLALIINIKTFNLSPSHPMYGKLPERVGSEKDLESLRQLFESLKFITECITRDISSSDLLAKLQKISKTDNFSAYDCFFVCFMSHGASDFPDGSRGSTDFLYASDGEPLPCSLIKSFFMKCQTLVGKPKLFFFQGCRGEKKDGGYALPDGPSDETVSQERQRISKHADVLEFYSCYRGYTSYRYSEEGSLFIQAVVEVFSKHACCEDVLSLVTKVKDRVRQHHLEDKQMPVHHSTLTKKLYFWPGLDF